MNSLFCDIIYALSNLYDIMSIKIKKLKVKKEICQKNCVYIIGGLFYDGFQESFLTYAFTTIFSIMNVWLIFLI